MTLGVSARCALCFVLATIGSVRLAHAQDEARRQVAIIDLTEDDQVKTLSDQIYAAINKSDVLSSPDVRGFDPYLTGALFDEDSENLDRARRELASAETLYWTQLDSRGAEVQAVAGEKDLAQILPTAAAQAVYADLSLALGLALLDQHNAQEASLAFAFAHRLDPSRQLDPARYSPDILAAYKRASEAKPATFALEVKGSGRVWIDFVERGPAPGTFEGLEAGHHVVVVTGADRVTDGQRVTISAATSIEIKDDPASDELKVKRARLELSRAQAKRDDVGRSGAMQKLAKLLGVGDAIMISKRPGPDGGLQWETWKDRAPGFSAPKLYTKDQKPEDLLEGIAPPRKIEEPKQPAGPIKPRPIVVEKAWYEQRWVQASAAATVVGAIITTILWARRDRPQEFMMDIKQAQ